MYLDLVRLSCMLFMFCGLLAWCAMCTHDHFRRSYKINKWIWCCKKKRTVEGRGEKKWTEVLYAVFKSMRCQKQTNKFQYMQSKWKKWNRVKILEFDAWILSNQKYFTRHFHIWSRKYLRRNACHIERTQRKRVFLWTQGTEQLVDSH